MKYPTFRIVLLLFLVGSLSGGSLPVAAQSSFSQEAAESIDERGLPFPSEHYAPPEYEQHHQNWAVAQDERGLTYVANNDGIMQYDGNRWRLIPTTTGTLVRSVAVDSLVYVGAKGDFGYLRPDSFGVLRYQSLYERIPQGKRDFEDVWATHAQSDGIYFQANERLFRWDGSEITSWSTKDGFHTSFTVGDTLYVRDFDRGLLKMEEGSLSPVPGGEAFSDMPIHMMASHPSGNILIGTEKKGLFLYDGKDVQSFAPEVGSYLEDHELYHGCRLPGNRYALATLGGGILIVGDDGQILRVLDKSSGLPDEVVNYVYAGREGQLWAALNNEGLHRADLNAPTTLHDERTGLDGVVRSMARHDGKMHVATGSGLYVLRRSEQQGTGEKNARFHKLEGLPLSWDLLPVGNELFAATNKGVYKINGRRSQQISDDLTYTLFQSENEPQSIYAGTRSGLQVLRKERDGWASTQVDKTEEIRSLTSGPEGHLWATTLDGSLHRIELSDGPEQVDSKTVFDEENGLPDIYKVAITVDGKLTVRSKQGNYQVENPEAAPEDWQFARQPSLLPDTYDPDSLAVRAFLEDEEGTLWAALENQVFKGQKTEDSNTYSWEAVEPLHFGKSEGVRFHIERDGRIWLGLNKSLIRYAPQSDREVERPQPEFRALVRQVTTLRNDQIVYGGAPEGLGPDSTLRLPYAGNDLRFDVAAPLYGTVTSHQYQYKLAGQEEWSSWTKQSNVTFTNLWEGTYHFQVRARNERGEISQAGTLTLHIQPPWYRTGWAYLLYGIGFVLLGLAFRHYFRVKKERERARRQAEQLERERKAKQQLKRANERLREANRLKEEFLANTSHELRTPLTNILGFIDVLRDTATVEQEQFLSAIEENGKRLQRTLTALLDLSRLRSGDDEPDLQPTPLGQCVHRVTSAFRSDAEEKDLQLQVDVPPEPIYARADEQYLEQILRNLIENAIKFTEEGHVSVSVVSGSEHVVVEVADTGIGISEEFLPELFEDFKQESRGMARSYEGYGLGLSISSRLATLMGGDIDVESTKGEGSTFTLRIPRFRAATENGKASGTEPVSQH